MRRHLRHLSAAAAVIAAALLVPAPPLPVLPWTVSPSASAINFPSTADEEKQGARIDKEITSQYRAVTNPAQVARLQRIGAAIARVGERPDLTYHFKILDIVGINALSIPGGWVYVTEGMMRFVRTDDELAAVVAHEMTHINHRHYYIQAERQSHLTPALLLAVALSVLAHSPAPMLGAEISVMSVMNNYQRDLEREADLNGITYLSHTPYSPVAMLTLMEHLAQVNRLTAQPNPTGLEDHPLPDERVKYIHQDLDQLHIPIVRRPVEGYLRITLDPESPSAGTPETIRVDGQPIVTLAAGAGDLAPGDRALRLVRQLNAFFDRDPAPFDVRAVSMGGRWSVVGAEMVLFDVMPQDAAEAHTAPAAFAEDMRTRLARVIAEAPYNRKF